MPLPALALYGLAFSAFGTGMSIFQRNQSAKDVSETARRQAEAQIAFEMEQARMKADALAAEGEAIAEDITTAEETAIKRQKALAAKGGATVGAGSAVAVRNETSALAEKDKKTVLDNAFRSGEMFKKTAESRAGLLRGGAEATALQAEKDAKAGIISDVFALGNTALGALDIEPQGGIFLKEEMLKIRKQNRYGFDFDNSQSMFTFG